MSEPALSQVSLPSCVDEEPGASQLSLPADVEEEETVPPPPNPYEHNSDDEGIKDLNDMQFICRCKGQCYKKFDYVEASSGLEDFPCTSLLVWNGLGWKRRSGFAR